MKTKLILITLVIIFSSLLLVGCEKESIDFSEEYIFGQDDQYYLNGAIANCSNGNIAETNEGYYFAGGMNKNYVYYMDKETKEAIILCNKPNCKHDNETDEYNLDNCNAFFLGLGSVYYSSNNIYVLSNRETFGKNMAELYRVSLDGSEKELFHQFEYMPQRIIIHRGYMYYSFFESAIGRSNVKGDELSKGMIFRVPLSKKNQKAETFYEGEGFDFQIASLNGYKNEIFFTEFAFNDSSFNDYKFNQYAINIQNNEIRKVCAEPRGVILCNNNILYMDKSDNIYLADLNGENKRFIEKYDHDGYIIKSANDKYVILDYLSLDNSKERKINVYDYDGNLLKSDNFGMGYISNFIFITQDMVFLYDEIEISDKGVKIIKVYGLKVSEILNDDAKFELLYHYETDREPMVYRKKH